MFLMNWYQFFNTTACMLVYVCGSKSESLKSGCRHEKRSALAAHRTTTDYVVLHEIKKIPIQQDEKNVEEVVMNVVEEKRQLVNV